MNYEITDSTMALTITALLSWILKKVDTQWPFRIVEKCDVDITEEFLKIIL